MRLRGLDNFNTATKEQQKKWFCSAMLENLIENQMKMVLQEADTTRSLINGILKHQAPYFC